MKIVINEIKDFFSRLQKDNISECAAECAYFTILSFIPFIMFFITLVQFTNIDKETIYFIMKELIPSTMFPIIQGIIDEIYTKSLGTISITVIVALWSAGKGFFSLCKGLRKIYKVDLDKKPNWITRIEGTIYTLIFIIAIIAVLLILVFGNRINDLFLNKFDSVSAIISIILKIRPLLFIVAMTVVFTLIYRFVPRHKQSFKNQIYGGIFTSIAWYAISFFFSVYIDLFKGFSNMYGSLTSIILIMMWVYACMYTILLGAEINMIKNKKQENL